MSWVLMRKIPLNQINPEKTPLLCTLMHVLCFGEQLVKIFRNILNAMYYSKKQLTKEDALKQSVKNIIESYPSEYIVKEVSLGYFDTLLVDEVDLLSDDEQQEIERKQQTLFQLSDILFKKLSTLLSI